MYLRESELIDLRRYRGESDVVCFEAWRDESEKI